MPNSDNKENRIPLRSSELYRTNPHSVSKSNPPRPANPFVSPFAGISLRITSQHDASSTSNEVSFPKTFAQYTPHSAQKGTDPNLKTSSRGLTQMMAKDDLVNSSNFGHRFHDLKKGFGSSLMESRRFVVNSSNENAPSQGANSEHQNYSSPQRGVYLINPSRNQLELGFRKPFENTKNNVADDKSRELLYIDQNQRLRGNEMNRIEDGFGGYINQNQRLRGSETNNAGFGDYIYENKRLPGSEINEMENDGFGNYVNQNKRLHGGAINLFENVGFGETPYFNENQSLRTIDRGGQFFLTPTKMTQFSLKSPAMRAEETFGYPHHQKQPISDSQSSLIDVSRLPDKFRSLFNFSQFNAVQSACYSLVMDSDKNLVVSAPTGSGKTCIMELAIVRLFKEGNRDSPKIIYLAPTKALCAERASEWSKKFRTLGISCHEMTGDTDTEGYRRAQQSDIIVTTPEKWDSTTRRWRDYKNMMGMIRLFLIDEVHMLNEPTRGATLEVVVSRMRTVNKELQVNRGWGKIRLIAISATVPNIEDVAAWLQEDDGQPAQLRIFGEEYRPIKLQREVIGITANGNAYTTDALYNK
ncbi:Sec63, partial [Nowakowskiella sp. JEL0407]